MILLPKAPIIISRKDNLAVFEIENLYPGYGVTIGNSLRRVLLSSLEGAAITQVSIKGVSHEFSTIDGVLEDMIVIMMNLKQLRFKLFTDEPIKVSLKVKGEKEITAADFDLPSQVEILNPEAPIATVTDKKKEFEMEVQIQKGFGYEPIERRKHIEKQEIGVLPVDAIFTPAKRINFRVENMRVGERTDYDRLTLEIETDGSISPEDAFYKACKLLVDHFALLEETFKKPEIEVKKEEKVSEPAEEDKNEDVLKTKVEELKQLSTKTVNTLSSNNIKTVAGLVKKTEEGLLELDGMGEKAVKEVKSALKKLGLELKPEKE